MNTQSSIAVTPATRTMLYRQILVALDSSDHANSAMDEAVTLAGLTEGARLTGVHAYAAKLHDDRFRQMEGGLPEQFREEQELERQRDVHDDLITRGLTIITDSYLDQAERNSAAAGIPFARRSLEGKNYRELVKEANNGSYDLLVMGSLGLGAVEGSRLGTVCQRVTRRVDIDTLVIKDPKCTLSDGPVVVAIDGSARAYGGLMTALSLAHHWGVAVKVVSVFDPYFHYVAFNRIAGVLSEEAGKVFRFKEQERLHEEIIDSGLAKIYQGHLDVADTIAEEHGVDIETVLLDGKPYDAIGKYIKQTKPTLLIVGKLGIHTDAELDIGGNTEALLQDVSCAVLISQREYQPQIDVIAQATTSWTKEAERAMEKVPGFVRNMAQMAILRYAQKQGHTVITESIVDKATADLCPSHAREAMAEIVNAYDEGAGQASTGAEPGFEEMPWSEGAKALLHTVKESAVRANISKRAEKKARADGAEIVEMLHIEAFLSESAAELASAKHQQPATSLHWQADALTRLVQVPKGFMRDNTQQRIECYAEENGISDITLEVAEAGLQQAREQMEQAMQQKAGTGTCPFGHDKKTSTADTKPQLIWTQEAEERLQHLPEGIARDMTRKAVSTLASENGLTEIDGDFVEQVLATFKQGSEKVTESLPWDDDARAGICRAPGVVRGMLIKEMEAWARRQGLSKVERTVVEAVKTEWHTKGYFHLDPEDPRSSASASPVDSQFGAREITPMEWASEAEERMQKVPEGFMRDLTRQRVEAFAKRKGISQITPELIEEKYAEWASGSGKQRMQLEWDPGALARIARIPDFVRGMVIKEVERCAHENNVDTVTTEILTTAMGSWEGMGTFHSQAQLGFYKGK